MSKMRKIILPCPRLVTCALYVTNTQRVGWVQNVKTRLKKSVKTWCYIVVILLRKCWYKIFSYTIFLGRIMQKLNYRESLLSDDISQKSLAKVSEGRRIQAETGGSTRSFFKIDTDRRKMNNIRINNQNIATKQVTVIVEIVIQLQIIVKLQKYGI